MAMDDDILVKNPFNFELAGVLVNDSVTREVISKYHIFSTKINAGTRKLPMTEEVYQLFCTILEERPTNLSEIMVDGHMGFLFRDKEGMPLVAMHWENRFQSMVGRYNEIYQVQMPHITPHVCRHTYYSNMVRAGMNPKTLQYLMGHSDISVTMNTHTHLGLDDAKDEMIRLQELEDARKEFEKTTERPQEANQRMFRVV